jgi:hypothetical protein
LLAETLEVVYGIFSNSDLTSSPYQVSDILQLGIAEKAIDAA